MPMWTNCKSLGHVPHTDWVVLPNGAAISKFPLLDRISLYHSSLGAFEQPGKFKAGLETKTPLLQSPPTDGDFRHLILDHFAGVVIEPNVATVNGVE